MLSIASTSTLGFVQPIITRVAEISIVGFDKPRYEKEVKQLLNAPTQILSAPKRAVERAASKICMQMSYDARTIGAEFDPLNLKNADTFMPFREAEIKHGRLAMLAAIAWPIQEILHPILVDAAYDANGKTIPDVLVESNGFSPSLLNGGLFQAEVVPALALGLIVGAFLEETELSERKAKGLKFNEYPADGNYVPGDLGFDPLNIYKPLPPVEKRAMLEREILNGRVAMLAITGYVGAEFYLGMPIVRATPQMFEPLFLWPGFRAFMDQSFSMASMDGSINGIAY